MAKWLWCVLPLGLAFFAAVEDDDDDYETGVSLLQFRAGPKLVRKMQQELQEPAAPEPEWEPPCEACEDRAVNLLQLNARSAGPDFAYERSLEQLSADQATGLQGKLASCSADGPRGGSCVDPSGKSKHVCVATEAGKSCVCQWEFAESVAARGCVDVVCAATNRNAAEAYKGSTEPKHKAALACLERACGAVELVP